MTIRHTLAELERVTCVICLTEVPKSAAASSEAADYVMYFCGIECYEEWRKPEKVFDDQLPRPSS